MSPPRKLMKAAKTRKVRKILLPLSSMESTKSATMVSPVSTTSAMMEKLRNLGSFDSVVAGLSGDRASTECGISVDMILLLLSGLVVLPTVALSS